VDIRPVINDNSKNDSFKNLDKEKFRTNNMKIDKKAEIIFFNIKPPT
jgi:hypothetical protein